MIRRIFTKKLTTFALVISLSSLLLSACGGDSSKPSNTGTSGNAAETTSGGETKALTVEQIANLKSADREKMLIEGAKKEGKLTWYTTIIIDQAVRPLIENFNKKYPFIKVEYYRANSQEVVQKVLSEYQAKRYVVDLVDGTIGGAALKKGQVAQAFYSPYLDAYPAELKDKDNQWAITHMYYYALGYNTKMVSKQEVPKTYEDLLDPKWKGKMVWGTTSNSGAPGFVGNILLNYGEQKGMEYLKKLSQQNIAKMSTSARAVLDRVIAGEYPIALQIFNHHAVISAEAGAPSDWQPLEPVLASGSTISILKNAPNPYSAMLFMDFILNEGQQILSDAQYIPANPKVQPKFKGITPQDGHYKFYFLNPEKESENREKWVKVVNELFLK